MPLINNIINLILIWSTDCVIFSEIEETKFKITDSNLYTPVVILWTQHWNQDLKKQLIRININQKFHQKDKINILIS